MNFWKWLYENFSKNKSDIYHLVNKKTQLKGGVNPRPYG